MRFGLILDVKIFSSDKLIAKCHEFCTLIFLRKKPCQNLLQQETRCVCETQMPPERPFFKKCNLYICP